MMINCTGLASCISKYPDMKTIKNNIRVAVKACMLLLLCTKTFAATYVVTNTNDSGAGSLRQAITDANANAGADMIQFLIPDLALPGQYFEGAVGARFAVIRLISALPVITDAVSIDGSTQPNSNTGVMPGRVVGADNIVQSAINYPDVYIIADVAGGYLRSTNTTTLARGYGNGININAVNVSIKGIAISGFGNTSTAASTAGLSGDICILRSAFVRIANISITECFISCDPLGVAPTQASNRRSLSAGIVLGGNNFNGVMSRNYIRNTGTYGIHFNGGVDHAAVGPSGANLPNRDWVIEGNHLIDISWNNSFVGPGGTVTSASGLVADAINIMHCSRLRINNNYIENVEQVGIDIGWNADSNYVSNNSITNFTKTYAGPVQCGIRSALSSKGDSIIKNRIFNNSSTEFRAGVWIDRSAPPLPTTGLTGYDNENHVVAQNQIYNNTGSGIVLSTFTPTTLVNNRNNKFSQNIIYDNTGLAIDLEFAGTAGPTAVSVNDDADSDAGTNNILNFPVIDSAIRTPTAIRIWGKVAAGATLEFFFTDGGANMHGGRLYPYGEAEYYIGTGVEGSGADLSATSGLSYNTDGNVASGNMNGFSFSFPLAALPPGVSPIVSATATISNNTSEMGPMVGTAGLLDNEVFAFSGRKISNISELKWEVNANALMHYFEVERSDDGIRFSNVGKVNYDHARVVAGQTTFRYNDTKPNGGANYYRIKTVYQTGKTEYSKTVVLLFSNALFSVTAGPNPFTNKVNIGFDESKTAAIYQFRLMDVSGRIITSTTYKSTKGYNTFEWANLNMPSGNLFVLEIISETGERWQKKLMH